SRADRLLLCLDQRLYTPACAAYLTLHRSRSTCATSPTSRGRHLAARGEIRWLPVPAPQGRRGRGHLFQEWPGLYEPLSRHPRCADEPALQERNHRWRGGGLQERRDTGFPRAPLRQLQPGDPLRLVLRSDGAQRGGLAATAPTGSQAEAPGAVAPT